jgi:hypothetical protein
MIIANPIYDVVFKYLLEDVEIARELLSIILGEDVQSVEVKPQETSTETSGDIRILRFDFKAVIKKPNGEIRKVLIELQKAKQAFDVMRFRRYLGDNYRKEDTIFNDEGLSETRPLPIITIYFLGFPLNSIPSGVVKKMVERLERAIASEEIRDKMDVEDELDRIFEREMRKKDEIIAEKEDIIAEKEEIIAEKEEIIAEKEEIITEKDKLLMEEKKRAEEEIQKNLELQRQIEALKKQIKP